MKLLCLLLALFCIFATTSAWIHTCFLHKHSCHEGHVCKHGFCHKIKHFSPQPFPHPTYYPKHQEDEETAVLHKDTEIDDDTDEDALPPKHPKHPKKHPKTETEDEEPKHKHEDDDDLDEEAKGQPVSGGDEDEDEE